MILKIKRDYFPKRILRFILVMETQCVVCAVET
jgi:hypothetical protein